MKTTIALVFVGLFYKIFTSSHVLLLVFLGLLCLSNLDNFIVLNGLENKTVTDIKLEE